MEEIRKQYLESMPGALGELYFALWVEVAWLHLKWQDYRELFAASPERIAVLNEAAPSFFGHLDAVLWEDVLLHVSRLTDPPGSDRSPRLTLRRLARHVPDKRLREDVEGLTNRVVADAAFARDWRNRRIAHREMKILRAKPVVPLSLASRELVEKVLAAIRELMNKLEGHYRDTHVAFESSIGALGGVGSLFATLERGVAARRSRLRDLGISEDELEA